MTRPLLHMLIWSEECQCYKLLIRGQPVQCFRREDEPTFSRWLTEHASFAFVGQMGKLSVLKEARQRGGGYWYAYRTKSRHTQKRYLGPPAQVSLKRLEETAKILNGESLLTAPVSESVALSSGPHFSMLLARKFAPPRLPVSLVERTRLLREMDRGCSYPLMLVSASAGSGKTTLLSAWVVALERSGAIELEAVVWLSLDTLDNAPIRFWSSVITALRMSLPRIGQMALALLQTQEAPSIAVILANLFSEIEQIEKNIILILDDYHVIEEQTIHEGMCFLLDQMPVNMRLVLSTRTDPEFPLSRLRVHGQLFEIHDSDLCFTQEETASFLLRCTGLPLSSEEVATLYTRTEGWVAGLHLAALSMYRRENIKDFINGFAGNHRFVLDFVQQDILAQLPETHQLFLLQTSIVTSMNAALCQALTQSPSLVRCQQMLEELERRNLFIVPLDEQRQWYRYHDLFRQALQARLHVSFPEEVQVLNIRAARFYEASGEMREAIAHAQAASDYPLVIYLIEKIAPDFWLRGEIAIITTWLLSLPEVVLYAHMRLVLDAALHSLNAAYLSTGPEHVSMLAQVEQSMSRLKAMLQRQKQPGVERELIERRLELLRAFIEARALLKSNDEESLRLLAQKVAAILPDEEENWNMIPLFFAWWLQFTIRGQGILLLERLRAMKQRALQQGNHQIALQLITRLALVYEQAGQLRQTRYECLEALSLTGLIGGHTVLAGYLHASLFQVFYYWNRLEEASESLQRLLHIGHTWRHVDLQVLGQKAQIWLGFARRDFSSVDEALQKLEVLVKQEGFAAYISLFTIERVRYWLALGDLDKASRWVAQTTFSRQTLEPLRKFEVLMAVHVYLAQQQYDQALATLEHFCSHFDLPGDMNATALFLALQLVAQYHMGNSEQVKAVAARLLSITEPEDNVRIYLDMGESMKEVLKEQLAACSSEGQALSIDFLTKVICAFEQNFSVQEEREQPPSSLRESSVMPVVSGSYIPLSRQELRVLRLLIVGHTYVEIAKILIVSLNTVKTQVSSIYRKLSVSRRAEAIVRVRQWHLL